MIKKFLEFKKLNESPDEVYLDNKSLKANDNDAVSFCLLREKTPVNHYTVYVSDEKGISHSEMEYKPHTGEENKEILNPNSQNGMFYWKEFYGRLWLNSKVISFWYVPKKKTKGNNPINIETDTNYDPSEQEFDIKKFKYYFKELERKLIDRGFISKTENLDEWFIEVQGDDLIKAKDFMGNINATEDDYKYHLMKTTDPRRKNRKKYFKGSDSRNLKWKQALLKSENNTHRHK